eukprot:10435-Heterococcus_DN1.PRE.1
MMTHIATQWGWLYDSMNAKVTVANYKRYKVVDMCKKKRRRSSIKVSAITAGTDTTTATTSTTAAATAAVTADTTAATGDAAIRQSSVVELQCESIRCGYDVSTDSNAESVTSSGTVDTTTSASTGRSSSTDDDSSTVTAVTYDTAAATNNSTTSSNDSNSDTVMRTEVPTADLLHELQQLPQRRRSSSAAITA